MTTKQAPISGSKRLPLSVLLACVSLYKLAFADALFVENFDYANGELLDVSSSIWAPTLSDAANPNLLVTEGALKWDFTNGRTEPVNNGFYAATIDSSGIDSGSLYAHFDITVGTAPTSSSLVVGRIASFWNGSNGYRGRLWIGTGFDSGNDPVASTFRIGLTEAAGSRADVVWDDRNFEEGAMVSIVIKYDYEADVASLYLNSTSESDPHLEVNDGNSLSTKGYAFRHKDESSGSSNLGIFSIDNLAITRAFGDVQQGESLGASNLIAEGVTGESIFLTWEDRSFDEVLFRIERRIQGEAVFDVLGTTEPNRNYFLDTMSSVGVEYQYQVIANNGVDLVASNVASANPFSSSLPLKAPGLVVRNEPAGILVSFEAEEGAAYQVEQSADLENWNFTNRFSTEQSGLVSIPLESNTSTPLFVRLQSSRFNTPRGAIGLQGEFKLPDNANGSVFELTAFGATPNDDSNDDAGALQTALSQLSPGDVLTVPSGVFHIKTSVSVPSGITLRGQGRDITQFTASGIASAFTINEGRSDITLSDFGIDASDSTLAYGVFIGVTNGSNAERIWIDNLEIQNFSSRGIQIRNANHVKVENCAIHHATNLGGGGFGYAITLNDPNNHNNWVTQCEIGPVIRHGVLIQYSAHNNLVELNTCIETTEDAYDLHGENEYANELRFNLAYWSQGSTFDGTPAGFGIGNTGATHDNSGPNNWVHHNEVYGYDIGLEVIQRSHVQYVDGNNFHHNATGIKIHDSGGNRIHIRGNSIADNVTGISATRSGNIQIEHNKINRNELGISLTPDIDDYSIRFNDLSGNATGKNLGSDSGVFEGNLE